MLRKGLTAILLYGESERARIEEFLHKMVDRALEAEGTCTVSLMRDTLGINPSWPLHLEAEMRRAVFLTRRCHKQGEHGVGLVKRDAILHELGEDTVAAMRRVKMRPIIVICDSPTGWY